MLSSAEGHLYLVFFAVVIVFLILDLGLFNRKAHVISFKSALWQSIFWVVISVSFGLLIYFFDGGAEPTLEYFSAYITEKALSVDNIFVILMILRYFKVDESYYHKILFWGILGAIIFRAIFIFLGAMLVRRFEIVLLGFGAFLIYSGFKILLETDENEIDPEKSPVTRFARKFLNIVPGDYGGKFFIRKNGKLVFTNLFLVLLLIETTDLLFAVDSIPAVFAISQNEFIIYTSNIFAVLGLRAMFFLLAGVMNRFYFLQQGLSLILIFIGSKMFLEYFEIHVPIYVSFVIILVTLVFSIVLSLLLPKKNIEKQETLP